jgi:hypothetical protein
MAAPKGNDYYKLAEGEFKRPIVYSPIELQAKFNEYIEIWRSGALDVEVQDFVKSGEQAGRIIKMMVKPPLSLWSFAVFAKVSRTTLFNYKNGKTARDESPEEYLNVITRIEDSCRSQMLNGAAVGAYKENLTSRYLGLAEKQEAEVKQIAWHEEKTYKVKPIKKKS